MINSKKKILVVHGPNLDCLGKRDAGFYGNDSLDEVNRIIEQEAQCLNFSVDIRQSNNEGELVSWIHEADDGFDGVVLNPAGYGYSSVAIRDAILLIKIPVIEVHLSNIYARELFRHKTLTAPACIGQICGFKAESYSLGLVALSKYFSS